MRSRARVDPETHGFGCGYDSLFFWIDLSLHHPGQDWTSSWAGLLELLEGLLCTAQGLLVQGDKPAALLSLPTPRCSAA